MKIVLFLLIVLLIGKDTSQLNDPYIMRGLAEALCLAVGGLWVLMHLSFSLIKRYWILAGYVVALLISATFSINPPYVLLQIVSLVSILLFFIAYFESHRLSPAIGVNAIAKMTVILYTLVAAGSLIVVFTHPDIAYGTMRNGWAGLEYRFRGLFSKPAMLASATGLTIGLSWFANYRLFLKIPAISLSVICLIMTYSRTYWMALIVAGLATYWVFERKLRKWIFAIFLTGGLVWLAFIGTGIQFDLKQAKFLRVETISNLTGRVSLWEEGMRAFYRQPLFGYGFTTGASGLTFLSRNKLMTGADIESTRNIGRATLHSGYLQSLLDSGAVGTFFYVSIIVLAIWRILKIPEQCQYRGLFFVLVFKAVCNFSESAIYSASVFDSVLFFAFAVCALGATREPRTIPESEVAPEKHRPFYGYDLRSRAAAIE